MGVNPVHCRRSAIGLVSLGCQPVYEPKAVSPSRRSSRAERSFQWPAFLPRRGRLRIVRRHDFCEMQRAREAYSTDGLCVSPPAERLETTPIRRGYRRANHLSLSPAGHQITPAVPPLLTILRPAFGLTPGFQAVGPSRGFPAFVELIGPAPASFAALAIQREPDPRPAAPGSTKLARTGLPPVHDAAGHFFSARPPMSMEFCGRKRVKHGGITTNRARASSQTFPRRKSRSEKFRSKNHVWAGPPCPPMGLRAPPRNDKFASTEGAWRARRGPPPLCQEAISTL